jgi:hypothetical protein
MRRVLPFAPLVVLPLVLACAQDGHTVDSLPRAIKALAGPDAKSQEQAKRDLLTVGEPARKPLRTALVASKDVGFQKRAGEVLRRIATAKGVAALRAQVKVKAGEDVTLTEVYSPYLSQAFPRHGFYRITTQSEYYKPGQSWHGETYAVVMDSAKPTQLYRVGHSTLPDAWNALLKLGSQASMKTKADVALLLEASHQLFEFPGGPVKAAAVSRSEKGWTISSHLELRVDSAGRPTELIEVR